MKRWQEANEALVLSNLRSSELMEEARQDQEKLRIRERQQAAVAELGQQALSGMDLQSLMDSASMLVAQTLDVEYAKILELLPDEKELLLRAGVGWKEGYVGRAKVGTGSDSQAGHALMSGAPVIVEDMGGETRFSGSLLFREHDVVSGMSVIIPGGGRPYGVLGAHSTSHREFSIDDIHFLQAIANVVAAAIDRRRMEDELHRSRDQLQAILEGVADGITVQDKAGKLIFANDAAAHIVGYPSAEALLQTPVPGLLDQFDIRDEHGHPFPPSEFPGRAVLRGEPASERRLRSVNKLTGEERWMVVKARPVLDQDGKPLMAINIFRDITDRRRAEEAQHLLADATALLASSLDYETTLTRVAWLAVPHIADWCAVHLVGEGGQLQTLALAHVDPEKVEMARRLELRYALHMEGAFGVPNVIRSGEPELYPDIPEEMIAQSARDTEHLQALREIGIRSVMIVPMAARGRTLGAVTFVSAESGRRYKPEDLELAKHLGRRAALAVENARLYREAQEAVRLRNELFSSVSHDLKNPLTGIKGMAQLLKRQIARLEVPGRERLLDGLSSINATASRMNAQIDELLDLARLQTGQPLTLNRKPVDLVSLVREVAGDQQRTTERHRVIVVATPPDLVGEWDPVRLGRVVVNLLSNAIKYSPEGGEVRAHVTRENRDGRAWAVLTVQDQGIGIPSADLPRVFEGFHRAGNVEGQIAGTGLGLTSARQIVELHGGTIDVVSKEGAGSTFTVRLPLPSLEQERLGRLGTPTGQSAGDEDATPEPGRRIIND